MSSGIGVVCPSPHDAHSWISNASSDCASRTPSRRGIKAPLHALHRRSMLRETVRRLVGLVHEMIGPATHPETESRFSPSCSRSRRMSHGSGYVLIEDGFRGYHLFKARGGEVRRPRWRSEQMGL